MPDTQLYRYKNNSKLIRAWEAYYEIMGLSHNKKMGKVTERVRKGKFPNK